MGYFSWVNMNALKSGYTFLEVLNLAMASEGGLATVKRDGIFNCYQMDYLADTAVEATFTDIPADIDHAAGVLSYTDIQASYSTRALCNNLTIINKDVAVGEEVETVYGPFTNSASAEVWGASKVDVTMNYASGGAIPQRTGSLSAVGAEIVAKPSNTTPQIRVSSIDFTVDATDADLVDIAKTLTTFSKVQVQYHTETNTIDKPHIIVGVKHSISPTKWKVSYDLMQLEELI
jgi:hypothetical protein